jgi:hypothetical protein
VYLTSDEPRLDEPELCVRSILGYWRASAKALLKRKSRPDQCAIKSVAGAPRTARDRVPPISILSRRRVPLVR